MPWPEIDPKMVTTVSGPEEGVGAKSSWVSEGQMGVGPFISRLMCMFMNMDKMIGGSFEKGLSKLKGKVE